jgi:hypothetical protein
MSTNGVSSFHTEFSGCSGPACFWEDERRLEFQENVMAENRIIFRKVPVVRHMLHFLLIPKNMGCQACCVKFIRNCMSK